MDSGLISGIYKLTFSSGRFYIGKSNDIERRWKQHERAMLKGNHAKQLQEEFNRYGDPRYEVLLRCHADHIDIMEGYLINLNWVDGYILNTTKVAELTFEEKNVIRQTINGSIWEMSTIDHLLMLSAKCDEVDALKERVEEIVEGTALETAEDQIDSLVSDLTAAKKEIARLKSRNWFQRLFNF